MKWEPIKSAPKDAPGVLLFVEGYAVEGYWSGNSDGSGAWQTISLPSHGCGCCGRDNDDPTHWMPLPESPL